MKKTRALHPALWLGLLAHAACLHASRAHRAARTPATAEQLAAGPNREAAAADPNGSSPKGSSRSADREAAAGGATSPAAREPLWSPLSLGSWEPLLPACRPAASEAERTFCQAARRACQAAWRDDADDPSQLLALLNALEVRAELGELAASWHAPLVNAYARARLLAELSGPLRLLRRAVEGAYLDPRSGLYRGIDAAACRRAFAELNRLSGRWPDLVVTLEPLGSYPLSTFERFCLGERQLP